MSLFESMNIDGLVISGGTNRRYLSGWSADDHASDRPSGVMLVTPDEKLLYASSTNLPWAQAEAYFDVDCLELSGTWPDAVAAEIRVRGLTRIGFEDAVTSVANYWQLSNALGESVSLIPVGTAVDTLRAVKTDRELGLIRQALELTDQAFDRATSHIKAGMSEIELARFIDQQLRDLGSDGQAFDTIVASGPNAARPHHAPGDRRIEAGEPVIIDMGGRVGGYCGDLTRTIWAGQPSQRLGTMYRLVADAQRAAFSAIKSGMEARAVDRAARDVFAAADLEQYFVHGIGHAIGLRIHESPFLGQNSQDILQTGNVVTIEPGLYFPDWGGVRIEDVVVVEDDGHANLTHAPKWLGEGQ
jgi:Xaa-Pro aminopeptidase